MLPAVTLSTAPATPSAISIRHLTKRYGPLAAVLDLSLEVQPGEIFGFLGLNGAGKTTTIRILLDLLRPTSGGAFILGHDCRAEGLTVRRQVGYLPGEMGLYRDMKGEAILTLLARLSGVRVDPAYRRALQERLELPDSDLRRPLREYSTGMKRKLGIIQALQADPPIVVLDEPTEGLDPLMQEALYGLLFEVTRRGHTVFMSSHVLSEVQRVCDRVAVLRAGTLAVVSSVDEIRHAAPRRIRVTFTSDVAVDPARVSSGVTIVSVQPRRWMLETSGPIGSLVHAFADLPVDDLHIDEPKLEDVLLKYYRDVAP
jgi:ABC-2 type transport system ATP-binding protein